jgi:hypothetical protein
MRNIDKFDEIAGIVFAKLYESFPMRIDFNAEDISSLMKDTGNKEGGDEAEEAEEAKEAEEAFNDSTRFIPDTIRWLKEEGYITMQSATMDSHFINVTLTGKGLSSLKSTPDSVSGKLSTGEQLSEAIKTGGREALINATNQVLFAGFRLAISGF